MVQLGRFTRTDTGYAGVLRTLSLDVPIRIEPAAQLTETAPDHRVFAGDVECGAGWTPDEDGKGVLNVRIDDPAFPAPVRGRLVHGKEEGDFVLLWRRPPVD